jgi:uncharacterized protein YjdB
MSRHMNTSRILKEARLFMSITSARFRRRLPVAAVMAAILAGFGACTEALLVTPAPAPSQLLVSWSLAGSGSAGGAASAFDRADRLRVQLVRSGGANLDTIMPFASAGAVTNVPLRLDMSDDSEQIGIAVELRRGTDLLFQASTSAVLVRGDTARVELQLIPVPAGVRLPPSLAPLTALGDTMTIRGAVVFATGDTLPTLVPTFESTNPAVASITAGGFVTAHAEGQTEIRATYGALVASAPLLVTPVVAQVIVQPASAAVSRGQTVALGATVRDRLGNALARPVTWNSTNAGIAAVTSTGPQTAIVLGIAEGQATINATADGVTGSAAISVVDAVASVTVAPTPVNLAPGGTADLTATPRNSAGTPLVGRTVTWHTSNPAVAAVAQTGANTARITAVGPGTATITATSEGVSGTANVTVVDVVAAVTILPSPVDLAPGGTADLTATPRNAAGAPLSGRTVTWQSSNPIVATVTQTGPTTARVTAHAEGNAVITATSEGVNGTVNVTVTAVVGSVTVAPPITNLVVGDTAQLTATALSFSGAPIPGRTFTWLSSNPAVAVVTSTGPNTARVDAMADGQVTITATTQGVSGTALVNVTLPSSAVYFEDGFEHGLAWAATGLWNRTHSDIVNTYVPQYVSLAPGDDSQGLLPDPAEGSWYAWYGAPDMGNYVGIPISGDVPGSGGESAQPHGGILSSPPISLPAGVTNVYLNFATWFEIESIDPGGFDLMTIEVRDASTAQVYAHFLLNPDVGTFGAPDLPFSNMGFNVPPAFEQVSLPVSVAPGAALRIVLRFETGDENYNGFRGWIMDDISVTSTPRTPLSGGPRAWTVTRCETSCTPAPRRQR